MKFISYFCLCILSLFFMGCSSSLELTQATKTKIKSGRPNQPSFYQYEVYVTTKKGDISFSKIVVNNTIEKEEFSVKNTETKKSSMNSQAVKAGTYILSYKLKTTEVKTKDGNDTVQVIFTQNGKEQKLNATTTFKETKNRK